MKKKLAKIIVGIGGVGYLGIGAIAAVYGIKMIKWAFIKSENNL